MHAARSRSAPRRSYRAPTLPVSPPALKLSSLAKGRGHTWVGIDVLHFCHSYSSVSCVNATEKMNFSTEPCMSEAKSEAEEGNAPFDIPKGFPSLCSCCSNLRLAVNMNFNVIRLHLLGFADVKMPFSGGERHFYRSSSSSSSRHPHKKQQQLSRDTAEGKAARRLLPSSAAPLNGGY